MPLNEFLVIIGVILGLLVLTALIIARLYRRTTREIALVKTGSGGKRIIMDGGTIVIPLLHEIRQVNMKTLRLEVTRNGEAAMITRDRMRVDVGVEFYVSVMANEEGISRAAQTLGERTFHIDQLREMIEGKLIDGLRAVAAQLTMDELHESRAEFVQQVQSAVSEDLLKNGLMLESVSLTALDQTPFEALDENNAFNAVGMRKLAEVIAKSKMERAEIEAQADVNVRRSAMNAERTKLEIDRDEQTARIAREAEVATLRAAQESEIAQRRADAQREIERARIAQEESISAAEIARDQSVRAAEINRDRALEVAEQERQIIVAEKSEKESQARASADRARADAAEAAEAIITARAVAEAERIKQIALIEAAREAEREATKIRLAAAAERAAAEDRASARLEEARAEAEAIKIRAEAIKAELLAQAEGNQALAGAENVLSDEIVRMRIELARLQALPGIVAEMVKPAEKIDTIRIHQISGLNGNGSGNGSGGSDKPPVNQALDSIMGMAVQLPALRKIGEELGISMDSVTGVLDSAAATPPAPVEKPKDEATTETPASPQKN
ncbi:MULTISPECIES: flotillin family protein [unclassified Yoonia]|uniref:flotillin family protein n=1 Tax=unclassified Yoonia TaxID=2629118 RepID=UPI002AFF9684|nr:MULTISPECIES: flotillin domain-containing protein [unclassified Yoonia]